MNTPSIPATPGLQQCSSCLSSVSPDHRFCPVCNFPLKGTRQEQDDFMNNRDYQHEQLKTLKTKTARAAVTFYILAGIMLLWGIISFFQNAQDDSSNYVLAIYGMLSLIYVGLGVWSKTQPITAISCGLGLYLLLLIADMIAAPEKVVSGLLVKVLIIVGLIRALVSAIQAKEIRQTHKI